MSAIADDNWVLVLCKLYLFPATDDRIRNLWKEWKMQHKVAKQSVLLNGYHILLRKLKISFIAENLTFMSQLSFNNFSSFLNKLLYRNARCNVKFWCYQKFLQLIWKVSLEVFNFKEFHKVLEGGKSLQYSLPNFFDSQLRSSTVFRPIFLVPETFFCRLKRVLIKTFQQSQRKFPCENKKKSVKKVQDVLYDQNEFVERKGWENCSFGRDRSFNELVLIVLNSDIVLNTNKH